MPGSTAKLGEAASLLSQLTARTEMEKALLGIMLGATYALRNVILLGYEDRTGEDLPFHSKYVDLLPYETAWNSHYHFGAIHGH